MMRCPITYDLIEKSAGLYSAKGLKKLSIKLTNLQDFPFSAEAQREQARLLASKLSIQGVQPKLSAHLNISGQCFEIAEKGGTYIIKPQSNDWPELPENEDVTMHMAKCVGLDVPLHALLYCEDGSFSYAIRRFDRPKRHLKIAVEDFAQLSLQSRDTKYNSSMEQVAKIVERYTTFPALEKEKLFRLTLFSFLIGNEDMHLKNFSLIQTKGKVTLSPVYDLLNSSIVLKKYVEEMALPIRGKRHKLTKDDIIVYFGIERLGISHKRMGIILSSFSSQKEHFKDLLTISFLSDTMKQRYMTLLNERFNRLSL